MQKISVTEFDRWLRSANPKYIIYNTSDQPGYDPFDGVPNLSARFTEHDIVLTNPNITLLLKNENTSLRFDFVHYVMLDSKKLAPYTIIDIVCGGGIRSGESKHELMLVPQ